MSGMATEERAARVVLGIHVADEVVRVARVEWAEAASLVATGSWPLPRRGAAQGVTPDLDFMSLLARDIARWAGQVHAVRVVLGTPEQLVVRSANVDADVLRVLAAG